VIFGAGLVIGTIGFVLFQVAHFEIMHKVLVDEDSPLRAIFYMGFSNLFMKVSGGLFVLGIVIIAGKLATL
jgi:hypothetical protein